MEQAFDKTILAEQSETKPCDNEKIQIAATFV